MTGWGWPDLHTEDLTLLTLTRARPVDGIPATTVTETSSPGWNVQPLSTGEQTRASTEVLARWRASGPLTQALRAGDRVRRADGSELEIEGEPQHFTSGVLDHTEMVLVRWGGRS